jgi:hypothetical protein
MSYDVLVMAVNKKGKSGPIMLQGYTLKSPEKQTGEEAQATIMTMSLLAAFCHANFISFPVRSPFAVVFPFSDLPPGFAPTFLQIKPFLGTLLGIFGALLLILSAIILVVRLKRSSRRDRTRASQISNTITMSSTLSPSLQNGVLLREASADSIDKNPDIIPQGTKLELETIETTKSLIFFSFVRHFSRLLLLLLLHPIHATLTTTQYLFVTFLIKTIRETNDNSRER